HITGAAAAVLTEHLEADDSCPGRDPTIAVHLEPVGLSIAADLIPVPLGVFSRPTDQTGDMGAVTVVVIGCDALGCPIELELIVALTASEIRPTLHARVDDRDPAALARGPLLAFFVEAECFEQRTRHAPVGFLARGIRR